MSAPAAATPLGGLIASLAQGVADGQRALDAASVASALSADTQALQEAGVAPTFYQFAQTTLSLELALRWEDAPRGARELHAEPVGARYTGAHGFDRRMASRLRVEVVPVPPPAGLDTSLTGGSR